VGFLLEVLNTATYTMGFMVGKKIFEKKFGTDLFLFIPLVGGWVCLYLYRSKKVHNIA
jgi:hypothetical protein